MHELTGFLLLATVGIAVVFWLLILVGIRSVGIQEYRQLFFKPYQLIYRVLNQQVVIYLISDGRRDMQSLLARRLLGG